ncbi:unnamed protein product [Arctia plantaginis]|uniref:Uncharacterized protein n=1 Tax=Arctia plantaginis TaxID=874455 RepID=A0A8S0YW08_ARCPL|nr:unnamed protein product [Arctia plantaginis]
MSHPCSDIRNDSESANKPIPSSNHEMQWLNEQTGCFESIIEQAYISDNISEEEGFISESRKRKRNQENRMLGKNYTGHKVVKLDQNTKLEEVSKARRRMRDKPCDHEAVLKSDRSYCCSAISDEMRQDIFKYFWQLPSWDAKKSYINGLTQVRNILRRRKTSVGVHKKSHGFD